MLLASWQGSSLSASVLYAKHVSAFFSRQKIVLTVIFENVNFAPAIDNVPWNQNHFIYLPLNEEMIPFLKN
jgi:hypothetical protein